MFYIIKAHNFFSSITLICFLLSAIANAQETEQADKPVTPTDMESRLDQQVPERDKAWLNINGQKKLAVYRSETSGTAYGGVILIPDLNRHPVNAGLINTLRHTLADKHWHTLAVNMSGADEKTSQQIIAAGIEYLNKQGVFNIAILGEGLGATQALHYVSALSTDTNNGALKQLRAIVMINANNRMPGSDSDPLEKIADVNLPVLDAFLNGDYIEQEQANKRKQAARRAGNRRYQQIRLPQTAGYQQQDNRITKRIRGWLDKNAAGFMVDRK